MYHCELACGVLGDYWPARRSNCSPQSGNGKVSPRYEYESALGGYFLAMPCTHSLRIYNDTVFHRCDTSSVPSCWRFDSFGRCILGLDTCVTAFGQCPIASPMSSPTPPRTLTWLALLHWLHQGSRAPRHLRPCGGGEGGGGRPGDFPSCDEECGAQPLGGDASCVPLDGDVPYDRPDDAAPCDDPPDDASCDARPDDDVPCDDHPDDASCDDPPDDDVPCVPQEYDVNVQYYGGVNAQLDDVACDLLSGDVIAPRGDGACALIEG